jgi:hypothetical protein
MLTKYGVHDGEELRVKMDVMKQEPKQQVQSYYDRLEHLFVKGRILNVKRRRWFLAHLRPKIRKLCVVHTYVDMDELLASTIEIEKVLGHYYNSWFFKWSKLTNWSFFINEHVYFD